YLQALLFALALMVLVAALIRAGLSKLLIVLFAIALGANGYFSTLHLTVMTESTFATVTTLATAFWIDYLRTGKVRFLAFAGLLVGIAVGIRPAGIALVPMVA